MECKVLDCEGRVVGAGSTTALAIADAAAKLQMPWAGCCDGPSGEQVVADLIANGDLHLILPWR